MILELHAVANGDGTYTIQFVNQFPDGVRQYQVPDALLKVDNLVADESGRQRVQVFFNGKEQ